MTVAAIGASVAGAAVSGLMSKKGSKDSGSQASTNQTQTNLPWAELQPYLLDLYSQAGNLFNQGVPRYADSAPYAQYYPWQTTTAYDPSQTYLQGLNAATNYATNYLPQLTDAGMSGIGQLMGAADVANNPYVQAVNQQTAQTIGDTGMQGIAEYARQMGNAGQDYSLRSAQATGDYGRMLGDANQNFGMAANQATNRFGLTGQQVASNLGATLGNAAQNFGLAAGQAGDYFGRQSKQAIGDFRNASGQAISQFGSTSKQATDDMGAMFGNTLADWRSTYPVITGMQTNALLRDWLPRIRSGAGLAGQYGSSRQGIAEGVAIGDSMRALTDQQRNFDTQFQQGFTSAGQNLRDTISNLGMSAANLTSNLGASTSNLVSNLGASTSNLISNLGRDYYQTYDSGARNANDLLSNLGMSTSNLVSNLGRDVSQGQQAAAAGLGNLIGQQGNNLAQMYMAQSLGLGNSLTGLSNSLGTALTNTNLGAYGQGVNAMQNAVSMMPEVAELGMAAPNVLQGVGAAEDALRQKVIDADKARWDYEQNAGLNQFTDAERRAMQNYTNQWLPMQQFNSILSGSPYGTQTTTGNATETAPSNWANAALGGAAIGNSLYQQFSNPYNTGTTGNAWGFTGNAGSSSYPVQSGDFFVNLFE